MVIESKYDIGDRVWIVSKDERHETIEVFSAKINAICINGDKEIELWFEDCDMDIPEKDVIGYDDSARLMAIISELDYSFRDKGEENA